MKFDEHMYCALKYFCTAQYRLYKIDQYKTLELYTTEQLYACMTGERAVTCLSFSARSLSYAPPIHLQRGFPQVVTRSGETPAGPAETLRSTDNESG